MEAPPAAPRKNFDVECLRCGTLNIPENRICGKCGASLPLVYDPEGRVTRLQDPVAPSRSAHSGAMFDPNALRWVLRLGVLLFAAVLAWVVLHRPNP